MFKNIFLFGICAVITGVSLCFAQESEEAIDLERIVVTPYSNITQSTVYSTPYSAKVYTNQDIQETGAATVIDFLKSIPSINVSDYYGTDVKVTVDMMGFGDNAASNLLVLVNGRRINDIDMSGTDWTQLPLENVDKIEVIKGGGVVLYGDNSTGGIINIISKKVSAQDLSSEINFTAGSYRLTKESLEVSGGIKPLSFRAFGEYHSTDGYRQNSQYRSKYAAVTLNSELWEGLEINADLAHHKYTYGLPDDITEAEAASGVSRRDSTTPLNNVHREDDSVGVMIKNEFSTNLAATLDVFFRNRNEAENLLSYGMTTDKHVTNFQLKPQILFSLGEFPLQQDFIAGFEFFTADLSADSASAATDIDRRTLAGFLQDDILISENLSLRLGTRWQKEKFTFDYRGTSSTDDGLSFSEGLYEAGLNYKLGRQSNIYLNFSRGLRVGKTDEYLVTWPQAAINTNLKPQRSKNITLGVNSRINELVEVSLDYFQLNIENEIYYNPATWENTNYDKTRRQGVNVNFSFTPLDRLDFKFGYRFVDAEFREGLYSGKKVPFVPKALFTASLKYDFGQHFSLFVDYRYRGKVYLINDLNNISSKLNSFNLTNIKFTYTKANLELFVGINNLFNEIYSEYAAVNNTSATTRGFYPSPERNYYAGLKIKF